MEFCFYISTLILPLNQHSSLFCEIITIQIIMKSNYKKKATCDLCGIKSLFTSQITVFHIDGDLENINQSNLRSICLNCVEVVKKKDVNWKRGDLKVDY